MDATPLRYELLPEHLRAGMRLYFEDGIRPGDFLLAMLENRRQDAYSRADIESLRAIGRIDMFLAKAPPEAWGPPEKVAAWIAGHAKRREAAAADREAFAESEVEAEAFDEKDNRYKWPEDRR